MPKFKYYYNGTDLYDMEFIKFTPYKFNIKTMTERAEKIETVKNTKMFIMICSKTYSQARRDCGRVCKEQPKAKTADRAVFAIIMPKYRYKGCTMS